MKHSHQREENQIVVSQSLPCLSHVYTEGNNTLWGLTQCKISLNEKRLLRKHWKTYNSVKGGDNQSGLADKGLFIRSILYWTSEYHLAQPKGRCFCCRLWHRISLATLCKVWFWIIGVISDKQPGEEKTDTIADGGSGSKRRWRRERRRR